MLDYYLLKENCNGKRCKNILYIGKTDFTQSCNFGQKLFEKTIIFVSNILGLLSLLFHYHIFFTTAVYRYN
jgi:hypothetical protein